MLKWCAPKTRQDMVHIYPTIIWPLLLHLQSYNHICKWTTSYLWMNTHIYMISSLHVVSMPGVHHLIAVWRKMRQNVFFGLALKPRRSVFAEKRITVTSVWNTGETGNIGRDSTDDSAAASYPADPGSNLVVASCCSMPGQQ